MVSKKLLAAIATSFVVVPAVNLSISASEIQEECSDNFSDTSNLDCLNDFSQTDNGVSSQNNTIDNIDDYNQAADLIKEKSEINQNFPNKGNSNILNEQDSINVFEETENQNNNLEMDSNIVNTNNEINEDQEYIELGGLELEGDFSWQAPSKSKIKIESVTTRPDKLKETYDRYVQVDYFYSEEDDINHFVDFYIESEKCNWTKYDEDALVWIYKLEEGNRPLLADADYFYLSHVGGIIKNNILTFKFYTNEDNLTYEDLFKPYGTVAYCSYELPVKNDGTEYIDKSGHKVFSKDGLLYQILDNQTVNVKAIKNNTAEELLIPAEVVFRNNKYKVVRIGHDTELPNVATGPQIKFDFSEMPNLKKITISSGVELWEWCFSGCNLLEDITILDGISEIPRGAFSYLPNLKNVKLPSTLVAISRDTFRDCKVLEEIDLPDNIRSIGWHAFENCTNLKKIYIPRTLTEIFDGTDNSLSPFKRCNNLTIYGYKGSFIESYALKMGIPFVDLDDSNNIYELHADCTFDGKHIYAGDSELIDVFLTINGNYVDNNWADKVIIATDNGDLLKYEILGKESDLVMRIIASEILTGKVELIIQYADSGATLRIPLEVLAKSEQKSYSINGVPVFYPDVLGDMNLATNFYDFGKLYMNNFHYDLVKDEKRNGYNVSFNIYNHSFLIGSVDVYDKDGKLVTVKKLKPWQGTTRSSIRETGMQAYDVVYDLFTLNGWSYQSRELSKETKITDLYIPEGGYFTITNNIYDSPGAFLFNGVDFISFGISETISLLTGKYDKLSEGLTDIFSLSDKEFVEKYGEDLKTKAIETLLVKYQELYAKQILDFQKKAMGGATEFNLKMAMGAVGDITGDILKDLGIDVKFVASQILGVGEGILTGVMGAPGIALKALFSLDRYADKTSQMIQMFKCKDATTITILTDNHAVLHGVSIEGGLDDSEAIFQVYRVYDESININGTTFDNPDNYRVYNISYVKDGKEIEAPTSKRYVQITKPLDFKDSWCSLYRQEKDGTWTFICYGRPEQETIKFVTDHFSLYALIRLENYPEENESVSKPNNSPDFNTSITDRPGYISTDSPVYSNVNHKSSTEIKDDITQDFVLASDVPETSAKTGIFNTLFIALSSFLAGLVTIKEVKHKKDIQ